MLHHAACCLDIPADASVGVSKPAVRVTLCLLNPLFQRIQTARGNHFLKDAGTEERRHDVGTPMLTSSRLSAGIPCLPPDSAAKEMLSASADWNELLFGVDSS